MTTGLGHELKYAAVSANTNGANTLVAAVTGQKIKLVSIVIVSGGTVNATFKSGTTPNLSGAIPLAANGSLIIVSSPESPLFETVTGSALTVTLDAGTLITGFLTYIAEA